MNKGWGGVEDTRIEYWSYALLQGSNKIKTCRHSDGHTNTHTQWG